MSENMIDVIVITKYVDDELVFAYLYKTMEDATGKFNDIVNILSKSDRASIKIEKATEVQYQITHPMMPKAIKGIRLSIETISLLDYLIWLQQKKDNGDLFS